MHKQALRPLFLALLLGNSLPAVHANLDFKGPSHNGKREGVWTAVEDGKKILEGLYIEGKREGEWKHWDEHGVEVFTETYLGGTLHGRWTAYHSSAEVAGGYRSWIFETGNYSEGKKTGVWYQFYDAALLENRVQPSSLTQYREGLRQGDYKEFGKDGVLTLKGSYEGDLKQGEWIHYRKADEIEKVEHFNSGNLDGEWTEYWNPAKVRRHGSYKNGLKEGEWILTHPNYALEHREVYVGGKLEGEAVYYCDDGKIREKAFYRNGELDGVKEVFNAKGQPVSSTSYKLGKEDGPALNYHENGQLASQGEYKNGLRQGAWTFYFKSGKLKSEAKYKNGQIE